MKKSEILAREEGYNGFYRLERIRLTHDRFRSASTPALVREVVSRGDIVAVLPYDRSSDRFVMIEQFRPGALVAGGNPWRLEIVAGYVEEGESLTDAAHRETMEEIGGGARAGGRGRRHQGAAHAQLRGLEPGAGGRHRDPLGACGRVAGALTARSAA